MSSPHASRHRATARRRLPRAAVGAVVATVAVVLLLGGQGSLAFWKVSGVIAGGSIQAGTLALTPTTGCTSWKLAQTGGPTAWQGSSYPAATTNTGGTQYVEPHDQLTQTCTYQLTATGEHQRATLVLTQPTISVAGVGAAGVTAVGSFTVNGALATSVTDLDNGASIVASIALSVPDAVATQQGVSFTVSGAALTLQQVHA